MAPQPHSAGPAARQRAKAMPPTTVGAPAWSRAPVIALPEDAPLDRVVAVVARACRDHWLANAAAAIDGCNPEGVHQVRVALRRLRSALALFKDLLPSAQRIALAQEAKWLLSALGPVRDLDVFINVLAADFEPRVADDAGFAQLIRAARMQRDTAQAAATAALSGPRARRFGARLDVWLEGRGWSMAKTADKAADDAGAFARHVINRRLRKIKAAAEGIARLPVDERHDLRIAVKKARYGIEFLLASLPQKRADRWTAALKHVQDSLGRLNDLDVAERTIARLVAQYPAGGSAADRKMTAAGNIIRRQHKKAAAAAEPDIRKQCRRLARIGMF